MTDYTAGNTLESLESLIREGDEERLIDTHTHGGPGYVGPPQEYVGNVVQAFRAAKYAFGHVFFYFDESPHFGPAYVDCDLPRFDTEIDNERMALVVWWEQYGWAGIGDEWEAVRRLVAEASDVGVEHLRPIEV